MINFFPALIYKMTGCKNITRKQKGGSAHEWGTKVHGAASPTMMTGGKRKTRKMQKNKHPKRKTKGGAFGATLYRAIIPFGLTGLKKLMERKSFKNNFKAYIKKRKTSKRFSRKR